MSLPEPDAVQKLRKWVPWLLGAASVMFTALRLAAASDYDPVTAKALLDAGGAIDIGIAAVVPHVPSLFAFVALVPAAIYWDARQSGSERPQWAPLAPLVPFAILALAYLSIIGAGFYILITVFLIKFEPPVGSLFDGRSMQEKMIYVGIIVFIPAFVVLSASSEVWLPSEVVTINGDNIVAYVVEDEGEWVTLLRHSPRVPGHR